MKKLRLILLSILLVSSGHSQNLVPNGSFEQFSSCPSFYDQIDFATGWFNPCDPPYGPSGTQSGSSDYFNTCGTNSMSVPINVRGYQLAHTGDGYGGFILFHSSFANYREYIAVQLITPLIQGVEYHFEMYVNLSNITTHAIDAISVYFSDTLIAGLHTHEPLPFTPQISNMNGIISDTTNWTLISGNLTAAGGENYLLIGNFHDDSNTNLLLVNPNGIYAQAYYFVDDVSLTVATAIDETNDANLVKVFPSFFNDFVKINVQNPMQCEIIIFDIAGRKKVQQIFSTEVSVDTKHFSNGIYLYEVIGKNGIIKKGKILKNE